jgi:hypothetical protein
LSTLPNPAPADEDEAPPLPGGWRGALQTAPLWIPSSGGTLLGVLGVVLALLGVALAGVLAFGSDESSDWLPGGLRSGWVVVVAAALALGVAALRRTDLVWLWVRILRRDIPTAIVAFAALLGVTLVAITGGGEADAGGSPAGAASVAATATPEATTPAAAETAEATSTPTPSSTPLAVATSIATPTPTPAVAVREPADRPFALEALTFDEVCAPPERVTYQCGVLPLGAGIARLIEEYVSDSPTPEERTCNIQSYDTLVLGTLARNALSIDDTIQGEDVFALPPLPCSEDGQADRHEGDTAPAEVFLDGLAGLLGAFPESWADPAASELDALAAPEAHDTLLDVLGHFRDRYEGRAADITATSDAYPIDGDYYLLRATILAYADDAGGCSAHRHRWFALVEVDPTGRLVAVGDARFTSPFSASELC